MPIIKCPNCRKRYDPGVDEALEDRPPDTSLKVVCPNCGQWLRLPEKEPVDPPNVPADVLQAMMGQSRLVDDEDDRPSRRGREDEDRPSRRRAAGEEDDRPGRRAQARRDEEEDDDRPSGRRRRDDGYGDERDDFDDAPRRRGGGQGQGLAITSMILGILSILIDLVTPFGACLCPFIIIGAVLGLIGGVVAVILGFAARSRTKSGMAVAGIVTGFIAIALALAIGILVIAGVGFLALNAPPPQKNPNNPPFNNPRRF